MRILLASSEIYPYSKTGGLADMVGSLSKRMARSGHRVGVVTPLYLGIREDYPQLQRMEMPLGFPLGTQTVRGEVWSLEPLPGLTIYFVDQPGYYQREALYAKFGVDYPDNASGSFFLLNRSRTSLDTWIGNPKSCTPMIGKRVARCCYCTIRRGQGGWTLLGPA